MFKRSLAALALATGVATLTGCASVGETMIVALETPTVEAQANRVAVGSGILRVNHHVINYMPISADATWPAQMAAEMTDQQRKVINKALENDPWFATRHYSDPFQLQQLGGYVAPGISPLTFVAYKKINVMYGDDPENWPNMLKYPSKLDQFLEFVDNDTKKPQRIEAVQATQYSNIFAAIVSIMPVSYQKDLETTNRDMQDAFDRVAMLKKDKADLSKRLEDDKATKKRGYSGDLTPLSATEVMQFNEYIAVLDAQIKTAEEDADQKQNINFQVLDSAVEALKSDINLSAENVLLAQNLKLALDEVKAGAAEATVLYTLATTSLMTRGGLQNFDKELATLAQSSFFVPVNQRHLMEQRVARLVENVVYLLPSIGMGTYYAYKQNALAGKYRSVVEVVLDADASQKKLQAKK